MRLHWPDEEGKPLCQVTGFLAQDAADLTCPKCLKIAPSNADYVLDSN